MRQCYYTPNLELKAVVEVDGQLLDEGEQHGLREGAGALVEHFLQVHLLAEEHHQVEVGGRESQLEGRVGIVRGEQFVDFLLQRERVVRFRRQDGPHTSDKRCA